MKIFIWDDINCDWSENDELPVTEESTPEEINEALDDFTGGPNIYQVDDYVEQDGVKVIKCSETSDPARFASFIVTGVLDTSEAGEMVKAVFPREYKRLNMAESEY